jgi:uncharacterized membrane protein
VLPSMVSPAAEIRTSLEVPAACGAGLVAAVVVVPVVVVAAVVPTTGVAADDAEDEQPASAARVEIVTMVASAAGKVRNVVTPS